MEQLAPWNSWETIAINMPVTVSENGSMPVTLKDLAVPSLQRLWKQ